LSVCYLDTSALAKRYLNEARSDEVDAFLAEQSLLLVSTLTTVQMRRLLARRRRGRELDATLEAQVFATFRDDVRQGYMVEHELSRLMLEGASNLIAEIPQVPLRTLDALHLAAAQQLGAERLVTADAVMRAAAGAVGLAVEFFG